MNKQKPESPEQFYNRFAGNVTYTTNRKNLRYLLENTGGWISWNGVLMDIKHKHLGVGVYNIWTEKRKL